METLLSLLIWVGIGFSVGLGLFIVIMLAMFLAKVYEKRFPKKTPAPKEIMEQELALAPENSIFTANRFAPIVRLLSAKPDGKGFTEQLADLRAELWKRDIVVPSFYIGTLPSGCDFSLLIKIEGTEIFRGKLDVLNGEKGAIEGILSPIRNYFCTQEATKEIQKIENQGENR